MVGNAGRSPQDLAALGALQDSFLRRTVAVQGGGGHAARGGGGWLWFVHRWCLPAMPSNLKLGVIPSHPVGDSPDPGYRNVATGCSVIVS